MPLLSFVRWGLVPFFALLTYALVFPVAALAQTMLYESPAAGDNQVTYALAGLAGGFLSVVTAARVAPHSRHLAAVGVACAFAAVFVMLALVGAGTRTVPWWAVLFNVAGSVLGVRRVKSDSL